MTLINKLEPQDDFIGFYLIKELEIKQTNSTPPKDYFDMTIGDSTGEMNAKFWDISESDKNMYKAMQLVKIQGSVQVYRDKPQIKILKMRTINENENISLNDFIKSAPIPSNELMQTIQQTIDNICDLKIKEIVLYCVKKVEDKLLHYPAAKTNHHAFFAGLAYHIVRMLEIGDFICKQRPFLNADLVKAGIILHDIAKPVEMNAQMGIVSEYSNQGKLIGHIAIASSWVTEAAITCGTSLDCDQVIGLQHLILSHHNLGEWGSPVQPQMAEAVALHYIDMIDAKLQMVEDSLSASPQHEEWTSTVRGLEGKQIFRTNF
ncbi:3'-5' exoribonuclease YhaM [Paenibacillus solanacearum]|uniref:3'-5' exoribonuclease YhaM n=1 Tax=Paenibacillus solanacearum TaxID=2048548 RepID=A0A916K7P2_9BACL|nr:HD domain-containing protein [Paenibacillus solanacearum]CAG7651331.1 3'-5' exoribonuclease YhaM [Paenibacillus solanacearum]